MKQNLLLPILAIVFLSCLNPMFGQEKGKQKNRLFDPNNPKEAISYAFAVVIVTSTSQYGMTVDERNPKFIVEGIKEGLKGDSISFVHAQMVMQERVQNKVVATTPEKQKEVARSLGIAVIGGIPQEVEIPAKSFNFKVLEKGLEASLKGEEPLLTDAEMDSILNAFFQPYADKFQAKMKLKEEQKAAATAEAGAKFLAENGKRAAVQTTASGLQYEVLVEGKGPKPSAEDQVVVHYHGTLINGDVFDSSVDRGEPLTIGVTQVILGWVEGLQLMSVGAKYKFYIPQELAYGLRGSPPVIEPGATLIFEVELLEINPKDR